MDGTGGEHGAVRSAVSELDALELPQEMDVMVPNDIPSAYGMEGDLSSGSRTGAPRSPVNTDVGEFLTQSIGNGLPDRQGGSAGRIFLSTMMRLDDLDIPRRTEGPGNPLRKLHEKVDPQAEVGGGQNRCHVGLGAKHLPLPIAKTRGPGNERRAQPGGPPRLENVAK